MKESISSLTYYTIERSIDWFEQKHHQTFRTLLLYEESIASSDQTFSLNDVHDVSYRPFSNGTGLFYLHTNRGVFTFGVNENPNEFINSYKRLKGDPFAF
ncbi:hypothetical protein MHZ92_10375 [Sporosarcina sp. ACRSL]|uniref:hypothetical protein n=1 Tax=Sporosarcina sp. ACRSL TaxID=2918215 RepID=UPI001EF60733|nr:hypothetical protein [Sporosarcina sp. ACRSL]MCG7344542.1 hypothetical protein [Sporosarcina sp. ACRSL]